MSCSIILPYSSIILTFMIAIRQLSISQNKSFDRFTWEIHNETKKLRDFIIGQNNQLRIEFRGETKDIANLDSLLSVREGLYPLKRRQSSRNSQTNSSHSMYHCRAPEGNKICSLDG